jgi:Leucine-rich repeat (LRR) protein
MNRNKLWYVADNAVNLLKQSQLTKMGLSGCNLDRIPQALLQLQGLTNLDVSANNIQSIERFDMSNHTKISLLNVSHLKRFKYILRCLFLLIQAVFICY